MNGKSPELRHYWLYLDKLEIKDGFLCRNYERRDETGTYIQFLVPKELRDHVLKAMHDSILSGHLGRKKTTEKLLQRFYWFQVRDDVKVWVTQCR